MQHPPRLRSILATAFVGAALASSTAQAQWSIEALSQGRTNVAATTVDHFVLFAGGNEQNNNFAAVDIYDSLTGALSTAQPLSQPRSSVAATAVGHVALFGGGWAGGANYSNVVDVFDAQTMAWSTATLSQARTGAAATTVGTKALFAGGQHVFGSTTSVVDIYDASIGAPSNPSAWSTTSLSLARSGATAVTVGDLAIFAGGWLAPGGVPVDVVDIFDSSTGVWSTATLSSPRILGPDGATAVGSRAYFGGGHASAMGGPIMSDTVDIFDAQSGLWSTATLAVARGYMGVTAIGNTVLFAGGSETGHVLSDVVETFNVGTGQWGAIERLSQARRGPAAASIGGRALFAAGSAPGVASAVVDVFGPVGISYCSASVNSTGAAAALNAVGNNAVSANDLTLTVTSAPANVFGFFLVSDTRGFTPSPGGSQGDLCLGGDIGRFVGPGQLLNSGPGGQLVLQIDLTAVPTPSALRAVVAGETWHFQGWFRDSNPNTTSNLTAGVSVTFR